MTSSKAVPKSPGSEAEDRRTERPRGPAALALEPPAYGISAIDRAPPHTGPLQLMPRGEPDPGIDFPQSRSWAAPGGSSCTALPDALRSGIAAISGYELSDVRVYFNSSRPADVDAAAFARGHEIHLAPGQERHLPHEAWHVVQQAQGRVKPTLRTAGDTLVNDDRSLEREADAMSTRALAARGPLPSEPPAPAISADRSSSTPRAGNRTAPGPDAVIQRVYLYDGTKVTYQKPSDPVPPGYVRTGKHNDGKNGPDDLYQLRTQVGSKSNPFFAQSGYGKRKVEAADLESKSEDVETDLTKVNDHYKTKIKKKLDQARDDYLKDADSSDSETEAGSDPKHQAHRRHYKAGQYTAVAKTMFPLSSDDETFRQELSKKRKRDNDARGDKMNMYEQDSLNMFAQIGEEFKQTSFAHNPLYRRAFRAAIKDDLVKSGGSDVYDANQGKVRDELLKVIQADSTKMDWTREDFPSDEVWKAVEFMTQTKLSNAGTGETYYQRQKAGQDTKDSQARIGFHHVGWKEAEKGAFESHALNPANLTALSDMRELLNPKKIKALKDQGQDLPPVGAHDAFGHQGSGFKATDKKNFKRSKGRGQFNDIDLEATNQILTPLTRPRKKKKLIYQTT